MNDNDLQFIFANFPESKKYVVYDGRSSGSSGYLNLPIGQRSIVAFESATFYGLTAAGTAPVLHRIPFSSPVPDPEQAKPEYVSKIGNRSLK